MKTKCSKLISIFLILLITLTMLAGCGGNGSGKAETRTITDCVGRSVQVPKEPQHVACLYASAAHMMAMLGTEDKIAGCPTGVKSDVLMQMKFPEITETATPHQEGSINIEELVDIDADLALVGFSLAASEGEMEKLDKMEIPYVVVDYETMSELLRAVQVMGDVFDDKEKADAYISFFEETTNMVADRLKDVDMSKAPQVYHSVNEATRTDPEDSICNEIMKKAGVVDISASKGAESVGKNAYITLEEIYNWDPQAIIANEYAVTEYILSDAKWNGLAAVKNKNVYTLPVGATRWCHPGSMEAHMGVLAIAKQFYPEKFKDIDMKQFTADYYETYFDLKLDDKTITKILAGEGMRKTNSPTE